MAFFVATENGIASIHPQEQRGVLSRQRGVRGRLYRAHGPPVRRCADRPLQRGGQTLRTDNTEHDSTTRWTHWGRGYWAQGDAPVPYFQPNGPIPNGFRSLPPLPCHCTPSIALHLKRAHDIWTVPCHGPEVTNPPSLCGLRRVAARGPQASRARGAPPQQPVPRNR